MAARSTSDMTAQECAAIFCQLGLVNDRGEPSARRASEVLRGTTERTALRWLSGEPIPWAEACLLRLLAQNHRAGLLGSFAESRLPV